LTKIYQKYKQYGFKNFIKRLIISILRGFGIKYNCWLICKQQIDTNSLESVKIDSVFSYRQIYYNDFLESSKFTIDKLERIELRFKDHNCFSFGVYCNNDLAYYCWISLKEFQFPNNSFRYSLNENEGLLFDAFCFPEYRGKNIHNFMNAFRLKKLLEYKKNNALVVLLNENIPARKSQKKSGFVCNKQLLTFNFFGLKFNKILNKKVKLQ